jgi:hypothetical protein
MKTKISPTKRLPRTFLPNITAPDAKTPASHAKTPASYANPLVFNANTPVSPLAALLLVVSKSYRDSIPESTLTHIRGWRKTLDSKYNCIHNVTNLLVELDKKTTVPKDMLDYLVTNRARLAALFSTCNSTASSADSRQQRNTLLREMVDYNLLTVRIFLYSLFAKGILTAADVHSMGFLLPNERGGARARSKPTAELAEVKVTTAALDTLHVVFDRLAGKAAGRRSSGWPKGVRVALIIILSGDGQTEVVRHFTSRLHNTITMSKDTRGKMFIAKAAFLKHTDDEPVFNSESVFMMPMTTEDLVRANAERDKEKAEFARVKMLLEQREAGKTTDTTR